MLSEQGKRLVSMAVTATLCAGLLPASAVVAASPGGPGGPGAGGPPASITGAGGPPPMLNWTPPGTYPNVIPMQNMTAGSPTAGSIRSSMARKAVRVKGPQILLFEIHALGRLEDIVIHNKTSIHEGAILRQLAFLKKGKPISAKDVQRAAGLVTDLSGVIADVVSEKGSAPGMAVLHVTVYPDKSPQGDFSIDNYGNRYLGYGEEMLNYDIRNLTHEGDSLFAHIETTGRKYINGTIMYRRPVGKNGLTMHAGYRHLHYAQGSEFEYLKPYGAAKTYTIGLEYPIHRSQTHDLKVGLDYEYLDLKDEYKRDGIYFQPGPFAPKTYFGTWNDKHVNSATLSLSEKNLDKHGITTWTLAYTYGNVSFDSPLTHTFFDGTNCEGAFSKVTAVFLRHQKMNKRLALQLFARGQLASRNMDTSGRMGITGITGVKAYPISEVAGDNAYFTRAELQWDLPLQAKEQKLQLLTYLEHAGIKIFKDPVNDDKNNRHLQDIGLGLLWSKKDAWWVRADYAWKLGSEKPITDTSHSNGHFWIQGGFYF